MINKNILSITFLLFTIHTTFSQMIGFKNNVIYKLDLEKGNLMFSTKLKEPAYIYAKSKNEKIIYVQSKHYAYKIDYKNGKIIDEYQYQEILEKKENDPYDPNLLIIPLGTNSEGKGIFTIGEPTIKLDSNYQLEKTLETIYMFDLNKRQTKRILTYDKLKYAGGSPILNSNKIILSKKLDSSIILVEYYNIDNGAKLDSLKIKIPNKGSDFEISDDAPINFSVINTSEKQISIQINSGTTFESMKLYHYKYFLDNSQNSILKQIKPNKGDIRLIFHNSNESDYSLKVDCKSKEKIPYPKQPEMVEPKNYRKKAMVEAKEINDKRLKEYKIAMEKYIEQHSAPKECIYKLYKNGNIIIKLENIKNHISIHNDQYLFYTNEFDEYTKYDLVNKSVLWSIEL